MCLSTRAHVTSACTDNCQVSKAVHGTSCFLQEGQTTGRCDSPLAQGRDLLQVLLGFCHRGTSSKKPSLSSQHHPSSPPVDGLPGPLPPPIPMSAPCFVVPAASPAPGPGLAHRWPWGPVCPRRERICGCVQASSICYCQALSPACAGVVMLPVELSLLFPARSAPFLCHPHPLTFCCLLTDDGKGLMWVWRHLLSLELGIWGL